MSTENKDQDILTNGERDSLPDPMTRPEIEAPHKKGGFMGGGFWTTALFLFAFFLVSFSLGYSAHDNEKLRETMIAAGGNPAVAGAEAQAQATPAPVTNIDMSKITIDEKRVKGNPDAPVLIVEWSDFQCPYCERFYTTAYKEIIKNYVDTGKARFAFKDFPLTQIHPMAAPAALASRCAAEQNKFWEFHDQVFSNQDALSVNNLINWSADLGMNRDQFQTCANSDQYQADVKKDFDEGAAVGINGTPGFVINGRLLSGALPYSEFENAIEAALSESK